MMKNVFEKLASLLGQCSENRNEAERLSLIARIAQSSDYKKLKSAVAFKEPFESWYSLPALEAADYDTLLQRKELLHKIASLHKQLLQCLRSGNGYELSSDDTPDFTSKKSISRLLDKISLAPKQTNYSNIKEDNALSVFSENTIHSAQECLALLPVALSSCAVITEEDISKYLGDTLYCISIMEFEKCHREFIKLMQRGEPIVKHERDRKKRHALLKLAIILLCFGAVFAFQQFGRFSESTIPVLYTLISVSSVIYLIWG